MCAYTCIYIHVYMYMYMHTFCVCIHVHVCICVHTVPVKKKLKYIVPGDWFARDSLAVRSRFGRGSVGVRSVNVVRFGWVRCGARVSNL